MGKGLPMKDKRFELRLDAVCEQIILSFVRDNPGEGGLQISKAEAIRQMIFGSVEKSVSR